ncbi:uncharacterized protein LOC125945857 [Dermacentor silvarum]|uniref:uncharacterized protein LOC125945857 n=1 Tax=Dermacentor silvarum TaxID=543639 RepID=UPI002100BF2F|nr:uncharacterized protein LOC125945857 [Dermacentor silvarum]
MLAITLLLVVGLFVDVNGASLDDLIDALNTTQPIWLFNRSYEDVSENNSRICVRWNRENLTRSNYQFSNHYKLGQQYYDQNGTQATLVEEDKNATMAVNYKSGEVTYTLSMWNSSDHCFVLVLNNTNASTVQCELHLWHDKVRGTTLTSCDAAYQSLCSEQKKVFTEDECL